MIRVVSLRKAILAGLAGAFAMHAFSLGVAAVGRPVWRGLPRPEILGVP